MQFQEHITALGRSSQHIVISWKCLFISSGTLLEIYIYCCEQQPIFEEKRFDFYIDNSIKSNLVNYRSPGISYFYGNEH